MEPAVEAVAEIESLLSHLEQKLAELDQLRSDLAHDAHELSRAVEAGHRSTTQAVYSIREAARELGVSTSMLHKLLKDGRLSHLKVGSRTLITPEHLAQFRSTVEVSQQPPAADYVPTANGATSTWGSSRAGERRADRRVDTGVGTR